MSELFHRFPYSYSNSMSANRRHDKIPCKAAARKPFSTSTDYGGHSRHSRAVIGNLVALMTLPARRDIAETQFQAAQLRAIEATLRLTADVRRQYWRSVAVQELVRLLNEARGSAEASADLAKALGQSGAMNKLDQSRDFAFYAEISARLSDARVQEKVEHERLARLMGLWDRNSIFTLPARLPALPAKLTSSSLIEAHALERRVDLRLARTNLEVFAKTLGLTHATRYINALALGPLTWSHNRSRRGGQGQDLCDKQTA